MYALHLSREKTLWVKASNRCCKTLCAKKIGLQTKFESTRLQKKVALPCFNILKGEGGNAQLCTVLSAKL